MRRASISSLILCALIGFATTPASSNQVSNLTPSHRNGQTFLTWSAPPGSGWTYRVYASEAPLAAEADLSPQALIGAVGDSSWCDVRLSRILAAPYGYAIDSAGVPLSASQGLFVMTVAARRSVYYAVTAQAAGGIEDHALNAGANTLVDPVKERPAPPQPVYQRTVIRYSAPVEIYTLWTSHQKTPFFPAMANRPGLAFDCGIVRGSVGGALMIRPHPYGQNFLLVVTGSGEPGEWRLTLDDPLPNTDNHTWWYGYNDGYDVTSNNNPAPSAGNVCDYTFRRVEYTVDWARSAFPVDLNRVYASGYSMGGVGSLWLALLKPDLIAAVVAEVPRFDFSSMNDPNLTNLWNNGGGFRRQGDRLWGTVANDLPSSDGLAVYDRLNMRSLAAALESHGMPPIITFCGKNDRVLGWAEKIPFYTEMSRRHHGGYFFWDTRTHTSTGAWDPMRGSRYLYRFRSDRSYPALSHCSADSDPGDGAATSGDSVGTINGYVEWDTTLVDRPFEWSVTLRLRDLASTRGTFRAPESLSVDVTPRRLQKFRVGSGLFYEYSVTRLGDGATIQRGTASCNSIGILTVPGVTVGTSGCRLRIQPRAERDIPKRPSVPGPPLAVHGNPVRRSILITSTLPAAGAADLRLVDVSGRTARTLFRGDAPAGTLSLKLDVSGLPSGVYFVVMRQAGSFESRRIVVTQ